MSPRIRITILQLSTPYTDPAPSNSSPPKFKNFTYVLLSRFLDHAIILFTGTLLRTWESIVIGVIIN